MPNIDRGDPSETLTASSAAHPAPATEQGAGFDRLAPRARVDRYELGEVVGEGSMGRVYRARDTELARDVALKQIRPGRHSVAIAQARLRREAQAMARVEHPAVVRIYDVPVANDELFVAMELARGGTLVSWLRDQPRGWREVLRLFLEAGRGLAAAHHAGLVHRDVKPSNILLDAHGRAKISDFGLARMFGGDDAADAGDAAEFGQLDATITATGAIAGTLAYMAPEQFTGGPVDARADQFAFCVALWEALCGERPFRIAADAERTPTSFVQAIERGPATVPRGTRVPRRILAVIERGLAVDRSRRWPTMDDLLGALERAARPRGRWWIAAVAAVVLGAAAVLWATRAPAQLPAGPCGERDQLAAVWNPAVRARYLAGAAATAREDAGWFDWYAGALAHDYAASCPHPEPSKIECLDGALADLRAAIVRPERMYWPRLRALDRCGAPWHEIDAGPLNPGELVRLSLDGRQLATYAPGHAAILRERGTDRSRPLEFLFPLRWLPDGSIAGTDDGGRLTIVDPVTGRPIRTLVAHGSVNDVSPDLRAVAQVTGQQLTIVPIAGGEPLVAPIVTRTWILGRFSPDGRRFAAAEPSDGGAIYIDDLASRHRETVAYRLQLHSIGTTNVAWLDPESFVISGSAGAEIAGDLWRLRVDAGGHLVGPPQVLVRAERSMSVMANDAHAGELLVERLVVTPQNLIVTDDISTSLPGLAARLLPVAVDRARERVLVAIDATRTRWAWISLDGSKLEPLPALDGLQSAVTRDAGLVALDLRGDPPVLVALDGGGRELSRVPLTAARGASPTMRCAGSRCLVLWNDGKAAFTIRIDGDTIGPVVRRDQPEIATLQTGWDLSPDGTRIAFSSRAQTFDLVLYDLERSVARHTTSAPLWRIQRVWFLPGGDLVMSGVATAVAPGGPRFLAVRRDAAGRDRVVQRTTAWISAYVPIDDHRMVMSTMAYQSRLSLFESR